MQSTKENYLPLLLPVNNPIVNKMLSSNTRAAINSHTFGTIFTEKLGRDTPYKIFHSTTDLRASLLRIQTKLTMICGCSNHNSHPLQELKFCSANFKPKIYTKLIHFGLNKSWKLVNICRWRNGYSVIF